MAIVWKKIAFVENSAAQSVLGNPTGSAAVATAITVAEQTLVGRITGGNVDDLSVEQVKTLLGITGGGGSGVFPFYNSDGAPDAIHLTLSDQLPFFDAAGNSKDISLTT